ncbi:MAG: hypothetical protein AAFP79_14470 [Pseudomonadota bacterium]
MDDIDQELISLLSTKVGMLMEDHATSALTIRSLPADRQKAVLAELAAASNTISKLADAAQSISD